jgi:hypothetical protein
MALPRRQRRVLDAIDDQLTSADPHLARRLGAVGSHPADEPLPAREQLTTWASRLRFFLWEAFAAGAWPVPPLADPPMAGAAWHPGAGHGSILPRGQARQSPD